MINRRSCLIYQQKLTTHPLTSGRNVLVISHPTEMFSECRSSQIFKLCSPSFTTTESRVATGNEDILSIYVKFSSLVKITKYQKGEKRPIKGSKIQLIDEVSAAADSWCILTV